MHLLISSRVASSLWLEAAAPRAAVGAAAAAAAVRNPALRNVRRDTDKLIWVPPLSLGSLPVFIERLWGDKLQFEHGFPEGLILQ
jgi:hypothetical protein